MQKLVVILTINPTNSTQEFITKTKPNTYIAKQNISLKDFRRLYRKYARRDDKSSTLDELLVNPPPENIPVCLGGKDIPDPAKIFMKKLTKYVTPTTFQRHAIPVIMAGRDLMACAPGGSGKTGAFVVPIVHGVMQGARYQSCGSVVRPVALILCPTVQREKEVFDEVEGLCRDTAIKVRSGEGLANHKPNKKSFDVDILVATPKQILKICEVPELVNKARLAMSNVKFLALDLADQMLPKFHTEILMIIKHTNMTSINARQTMFFGVAFTSEVQELASKFMKSDYIFFCEGDYGSGTFSCEDMRTENNSTDVEYAYRRMSFSECDQMLGDDTVDWEE